MDKLKVSAKTNVKKLASAIASIVSRNEKAELISIGAGAVNQATKAVAAANGFVAPHGMHLVSKISFDNVQAGDGNRTAIKYIVEGKNV